MKVRKKVTHSKQLRHMEDKRQGSKQWDTLLRTRYHFSADEGLREVKAQRLLTDVGSRAVWKKGDVWFGERVEREHWRSWRRWRSQEKGIKYVTNAELKVPEVDNRR